MAEYEMDTLLQITLDTNDAISIWQEGTYQQDDRWYGRVTGSPDNRETLYQDPYYGYYSITLGDAICSKGTYFLTDAEADAWLRKNSGRYGTQEKRSGCLKRITGLNHVVFSASKRTVAN